MPEGHSIHRAARDQQDLVGQVVRASSPQGRFVDARLLDGCRVDAIDAVGKHLFYAFAPVAPKRGRARGVAEPRILHVHLGLAGKFRWRASPPPAPTGAVRLRLVAADRTLDLSGPLVCELIDDAARAELIAQLGPDPLAPRARATKLAARLARTRIPIGAMLLDQSAIAGLGNVYRAELLFLARIDPRRPSSSLDANEVARIWQLARVLLRAGVETGRIAPVDLELPGAPARAIAAARPGGGRHRRTFVYKQAVCARCGSPIEHAKLAGRPCYFCAHCQAADVSPRAEGGQTTTLDAPVTDTGRRAGCSAAARTGS